jgi:hypothetical protein
MKRLSVVCLVLLWVALCAEPSWYGSYGSSKEEIVGKGAAKIENKNEAAARDIATKDATYDISRQIFSEVKAYCQHTDTEGFENTQFSVKDVQIESCVSLCNTKEVKSGADNRFYYVVLSVSREDLVRHYRVLVETGIEDVFAIYAGIDKVMKDNPKEALRRLTELRATLDELSRNARILNGVYAAGLTNIVPRITEIPSIQEVDAYLSDLSGNMRYTYADLADILLSQVKPEFKKPLSYSLSYIEWLNTGFTSDFSVEFSASFASELEQRYNWTKTSGYGRPDVMISGQLIEEGSTINLILRFTGLQNQTVSVLLTPATIEYIGASKVRPKDLEDKLKDREMLIDKSIQSNQLQVMVKFMEFGRNPAVMRVGDRANIYLRANKACFITVINVEANGDQNVLIQNQRISPDVINEWIPLTGDFIVTAPTGVEQLLLQADVKRLPEIDTRDVKVGGGTKHIATGLPASLTLTRGLAQVESASEYTEDYLTWTVLDR